MEPNSAAQKLCFWLFQNLRCDQKLESNWFNLSFLRPALSFSLLILLPSGLVKAQSEEIEQIPKEDSLFLAQTKKDGWIVGGNFSIGAGFENNQIAFINNKLLVDMIGTLRVGKFILPKLTFGGAFHVLTTNFLFDFSNEFQIFSQSGGVFARYYTVPGFFAEGYSGLGLGMSRRLGQTTHEDRFWAFQNSVGVGLSLFWFDRTHFEFQFKYHHYRARPEILPPFEVSGLGLHAGLTFLLKKKPKR